MIQPPLSLPSDYSVGFLRSLSMFYLNQLGMICPLGHTRDQIRRRMLDLSQSGVAMTDTYFLDPVPLGAVDITQQLPPLDQLPLGHHSRQQSACTGRR